MPIKRDCVSGAQWPPCSVTKARRTRSQTGSESMSTPSRSNTTASIGMAGHASESSAGCRRAKPGGIPSPVVKGVSGDRRATEAGEVGMVEVTVYGAPWCPETRRCKRLLGEARVDYTWIDVDDDPDAEAFVRRQDAGKLSLPVVVVRHGPVLVAPAGPELFAALGVDPPKDLRFFDLIVAGAGPAGLSAALLAVREGMRCLVLEPAEPGGQAAEAPALDRKS